MKDIPLLKASDIEVKIKQVGQKGAVALLYKTARVDMAILDEVFGAMNWQVDYKEIKGNLYCGIGIRENDKAEYVWKWDCGTESREDGEGNEKKGEASDAFKRAGFKWGIGRELYSSPFIFIKLPTVEKKDGKYELENKFAKFYCVQIECDENRKISTVVIADNNGDAVYSYGTCKKPKKTKTEDDPMYPKPQEQYQDNIEILNDIYFYGQEAGKTEEDIQKWVKIKFKKDIKDITADEANELISALKKTTEGN